MADRGILNDCDPDVNNPDGISTGVVVCPDCGSDVRFVSIYLNDDVGTFYTYRCGFCNDHYSRATLFVPDWLVNVRRHFVDESACDDGE